MNHKSSKNDTIKHINNVQIKIAECVSELNNRALNHDRSKLEKPELKIFDKYTPKLKSSSFGESDYDKTLKLKSMESALKHHYSNNRHHPGHFKKWVCDICFKEYKKEPVGSCSQCLNDLFSQEADINQMNLIDIMEMFCDWIAATERHINGDIFKSLIYEKKRFKISDQLIDIFKNTAIDIFNKKPVIDDKSTE
jgi:hypothetical protein